MTERTHPPSALLSIRERASGGPPATTLTLPYDLRCRSRLRARLDDGREVGVVLARGSVLRGGDLLRAADGTIVEVRGAAEPVSTAHASDPRLLARAAYHLGNRHVALEVGAGWLRWQHDHVLDDMVRGLGLEVRAELLAFEPEGGAYVSGGHDHANDDHAHGGHDHDHGHHHHGDHHHGHDH